MLAVLEHLRLLLQQEHDGAANGADVDRFERRVQDEHPASSTFAPPVLWLRREPRWSWWGGTHRLGKGT
jgi:hypothetical protein